MTLGSLFSGVGGLELGLERAGLGPVLWQAESDAFCRSVLRKHWPAAKRYRDVREVNEHAERPDIICGGFPCQDISVAGNGAGLDGERSGLWREFARVVRILRPRFVVVENVAALRMRGLCRVLRELAACGYDAEWDCIPASAVGAPHRRDRLFVLAWLADAERDGPQGFERAGAATRAAERGGHVADGNSGRCEVVGLTHRGQQRAPRHAADGCDLPQWPPAPDDVRAWGRVPADSQPAVCGVAHGISDRVDRLRALGNAVVPAVAEVIGRALLTQAKEFE